MKFGEFLAARNAVLNEIVLALDREWSAESVNRAVGECDVAFERDEWGEYAIVWAGETLSSDYREKFSIPDEPTMLVEVDGGSCGGLSGFRIYQVDLPPKETA